MKVHSPNNQGRITEWSQEGRQVRALQTGVFSLDLVAILVVEGGVALLRIVVHLIANLEVVSKVERGLQLATMAQVGE